MYCSWHLTALSWSIKPPVCIQDDRNPFKNYRFSAFWLRSKCSICSYQLNIWYGLHSRSRILNWFLTDWIHGWACSPGPAGCHGIALPPWAASFFPQVKPSFAYCCLRKINPVYPNPCWVRNFSTNKPLSSFERLNLKNLLFYFYPIMPHFYHWKKNIYMNFILRCSIISRDTFSKRCHLSSYLPGSEDTVISKAVPSGRDFSIALRGGWSLRFPLMWGTREHNLWELGTAFALSPYQSPVW